MSSPPEADPFRCRHPRLDLTWRRIEGGAIQYVHQCHECGRQVGNAIRGEVARKQNPREFDSGQFDRLIAEWDRKRQNDENAKRQEWFAFYNTYLESPEWRRKRELVLKRARGICEGCAERPATQVHHLTYDHVGRELLFELVAVCDECHSTCHEDHQTPRADEEDW